MDLFYGDDVVLGTPQAEGLRLKPAFDPALLVAQDYIGAPLAIRGTLLDRLGQPRGEAGVYDLVLRAHACGVAIERIPEVLAAYPRRRPATPAAARRAALERWIGARPFEIADGLTPDSLQLRRRFDTFPEVTVVVPTRQAGGGDGPFVVELLDSLAATDWPMDRLLVLVGDDTGEAATFEEGRWPFRMRRIETRRPEGEPFNYAAKMNRLWRAASTEHLVLMNDDVTATSPGWLRALMTFAVEADVGGVGARLLFPDGRLQHAGVPGGQFGAAGHPWLGQPGTRPTYQDWALVHRDWSMVTGAVFATRRSVLEAVNGFEERFALEFNDADLCLRIRLMGLRIVCTPFAELVHREKASRGATAVPGDQLALFLNRWRDYLADDPAWHPRLSRDRIDPVPVDAPDWFA